MSDSEDCSTLGPPSTGPNPPVASPSATVTGGTRLIDLRTRLNALFNADGSRKPKTRYNLPGNVKKYLARYLYENEYLCDSRRLNADDDMLEGFCDLYSAKELDRQIAIKNIFS